MPDPQGSTAPRKQQSGYQHYKAKLERLIAEGDLDGAVCLKAKHKAQKDRCRKPYSRPPGYKSPLEITNSAIVDAIKMERGCADCGYKGHPVALEFDHVSSKDKHLNVSRMLHHSLPRLMAEIGKCEVVCSNCHQIRHHNRRK